MYAHYDAPGFPGGNAVVLRAILGRKPRGLQDFLAGLPRTTPSHPGVCGGVIPPWQGVSTCETYPADKASSTTT